MNVEVWGTPSNSAAGGGAVRTHKHCRFNPKNPAAVVPNGGCQPCCLVSGRVCLVAACLLARARAPFCVLLSLIRRGAFGGGCLVLSVVSLVGSSFSENRLRIDLTDPTLKGRDPC